MASERARLFRRDETVVIATAFLLVLVLLFPFLWLVTLSLKTNRDIFAWPPRLLFEPTLPTTQPCGTPASSNPTSTAPSSASARPPWRC